MGTLIKEFSGKIIELPSGDVKFNLRDAYMEGWLVIDISLYPANMTLYSDNCFDDSELDILIKNMIYYRVTSTFVTRSKYNYLTELVDYLSAYL